MGAAFSRNSIQDYVNESNNAVSNNIQNTVTNNVNVCSTDSNLNLVVGCCRPTSCDASFNNCTDCPPTKITGGSSVTITNTNSLNCKFDTNTSATSVQQAADNLSNSSNIQTSQINKTMQEACNFSLSDSENSTTLIQNLINNMFVSNVSNLSASCNNALFMKDSQNIYLCLDVEEGSKFNYNNANAGDLVATCITNTILKQDSKLTSSNAVINTISQYNETKQYGLLGSIIGCLLCVAVIVFLVYFSQKSSSQGSNSQGSNTGSIVLYVLILFFVILFIVGIALGIYFALYPADQDISPINVDASNNRLYFSTYDDDKLFKTYTAYIPKGTYNQGDLLATAIQGAMNRAMYPDSSALVSLFKTIAGKIFGADAANFVVNFNTNDKDFNFECWAGNDPGNTPRPYFQFVNSNPNDGMSGNNILNSINGINLIGPIYKPTDNATTGKVSAPTARGFWFYFWIAFGILCGLFLFVGILLIVFRQRSNKKNGSKNNDVEMKKK
jgi:heme/copper-type cytochrome/quinol oxidase subunit 2